MNTTSVFIDARIVGRGHTGVARYVRELTPRLSALGLDMHALVPTGTSLKGARSLESSVPFLSPAEHVEVPWKARKWRKDHPRGVTWVPMYNVPLTVPSPSVITVHDANHIALPGPQAHLHALYYRAVVGPACRRAQAVLAPSEFTKREILTRIADIAPERIIVTPLGVSTPPRPDGESIREARRRLHLPERYVAYLGNFKRHKNVEALLHGAHRYSRDAPLVLIGGTEAELQAPLLSARRAGADIRVISSLPDSELWPVIAGARVFAFPSRYEGFGLPPLEAMALGVPVVSSTAGSLGEVVEGAALTARPDAPEEFSEGIVRILANDALAKQLSGRGLARAKTFTWERCASRTAQVLALAANG